MTNENIYCSGKETDGKEPYDMIPEICVRELLNNAKYRWATVFHTIQHSDLYSSKYDVLDKFKFVMEVLKFGAEKYSRDSWKDVEDAKDKYSGALIRHLKKPFCEEDEESGLPHGWHALCNCMFLLWFEIKEGK